MPHKRAKKSIRDTKQAQRGHDDPPTGSHRVTDEPVSKRVAWVLGAEKARNEYRERKRTMEAEPSAGASSKRRKRDHEPPSDLTIHPSEPIRDFNRRVEDSYRPSIRTAIKQVNRGSKKQAGATVKQRSDKQAPSSTQRKAGDPKSGEKGRVDSGDKTVDPQRRPTESNERKGHAPPKEFAPLETSRRIGDVAQAPPVLTKFPRNAEMIVKKRINTEKVRPSAAQLKILEHERDQMIARYRKLREERRASKGVEAKRQAG